MTTSLFQILLIITCLLGVGLVLLSLPGTWLIVLASLLYSLFFDFHSSSDFHIIILLLLVAGGAELLEFLYGVKDAQKQAIPTSVFIASMIGGFTGAIIGVPVFLIGSVLGLLLGTYLGALAWAYYRNPKNIPEAFRLGKAALHSRVVSLFLKTSVAMGMTGYVVYRLY